MKKRYKPENQKVLILLVAVVAVFIVFAYKTDEIITRTIILTLCIPIIFYVIYVVLDGMFRSESFVDVKIYGNDCIEKNNLKDIWKSHSDQFQGHETLLEIINKGEGIIFTTKIIINQDDGSKVHKNYEIRHPIGKDESLFFMIPSTYKSGASIKSISIIHRTSKNAEIETMFCGVLSNAGGYRIFESTTIGVGKINKMHDCNCVRIGTTDIRGTAKIKEDKGDGVML